MEHDVIIKFSDELWGMDSQNLWRNLLSRFSNTMRRVLLLTRIQYRNYCNHLGIGADQSADAPVYSKWRQKMSV